MSSESPNIQLCPLYELSEASSRSFVANINGETIELFLVRKDKSVYAYKNSCPHTGGPLDWMPDQFLNIESDLIQCATHDALFQIETGLCVSGPCKGDRLTAVRAVINNDVIWLETGG